MSQPDLRVYWFITRYRRRFNAAYDRYGRIEDYWQHERLDELSERFGINLTTARWEYGHLRRSQPDGASVCPSE